MINNECARQSLSLRMVCGSYCSGSKGKSKGGAMAEYEGREQCYDDNVRVGVTYRIPCMLG
jgi:hypothetical protein